MGDNGTLCQNDISTTHPNSAKNFKIYYEVEGKFPKKGQFFWELFFTNNLKTLSNFGPYTLTFFTSSQDAKED